MCREGTSWSGRGRMGGREGAWLALWGGRGSEMDSQVRQRVEAGPRLRLVGLFSEES